MDRHKREHGRGVMRSPPILFTSAVQLHTCRLPALSMQQRFGMFTRKLLRESLYHTGALGLARRLIPKRFLGATVLLYHHVVPTDEAADHYASLMGDPTAQQLDALICYLKRSFRFSTVRECVERWQAGDEVAPFTLMLTFDDGYADLHDAMLPILRRQNVPATVFLTTGAINGKTLWSQRLIAALSSARTEEVPPFRGLPAMPLRTRRQRVEAIEAYSRLQLNYPASEWDRIVCEISESIHWNGELGAERMMTWDQVSVLAESGFVEFGGHTATHPLLTQCATEQVRKELKDCYVELKDRLGVSFIPFAYPNGRSNPSVTRIVEEAGFACAFTGAPGLNTRATPQFALHRMHLPPQEMSQAARALLPA